MQIPGKVLKLMKNDMSDQVALSFNLSFSSSSFPTILKTIARKHQFIKKTPSLNVQIAGIFLYYVTLIKSLKGKCIAVYINYLKTIYNLQFGFRQKHLSLHPLIHLTDRILEQLDDGKYGYRIFVYFQKAFYTVDHAFLTQKLSYYAVRSDANNWFSSSLKNST